MSKKTSNFYYEIDGDRLGPCSRAEIEDRKRTGLLPADVKIYERRTKKSKGSWAKRQMKHLKMKKRDFLILLLVLIATIIIIGLILLMSYNNAPSEPSGYSDLALAGKIYFNNIFSYLI